MRNIYSYALTNIISPFFKYSNIILKLLVIFILYNKNMALRSYSTKPYFYSFYSIVRISEKPVTSNTSFITSFTFFMIMLPCLFIIFWAARRTRSPAEDMYSSFPKSKTNSVTPSRDHFNSSSNVGGCDGIQSSLQYNFQFCSFQLLINCYNTALHYVYIRILLKCLFTW